MTHLPSSRRLRRMGWPASGHNGCRPRVLAQPLSIAGRSALTMGPAAACKRPPSSPVSRQCCLASRRVAVARDHDAVCRRPVRAPVRAPRLRPPILPFYFFFFFFFLFHPLSTSAPSSSSQPPTGSSSYHHPHPLLLPPCLPPAPFSSGARACRRRLPLACIHTTSSCLASPPAGPCCLPPAPTAHLRLVEGASRRAVTSPPLVGPPADYPPCELEPTSQSSFSHPCSPLGAPSTYPIASVHHPGGWGARIQPRAENDTRINEQ